MKKKLKTFVEIGTCDFDTLYHFLNKGWKGIMIDPYQPFLDKLEDHPNLTKLCVAISTGETTADYYYINDETVKEWGELEYRGMGSIAKDSILHLDTAYKGRLNKIPVPTRTFNSVMEELKVTEIDYLRVDTEGMDLNIIKSIDYDKFLVKLIKAETNYCDPYIMGSFLDDMGYHIEYFSNDIIAIKY